MICLRLHISVFEDYFTTAILDRYYPMCSIEAHEREQKYVNYEASIGGGRPLTYNSTRYSLIPSGLTLKFIHSCLKPFKTNYLCSNICIVKKCMRCLRRSPLPFPYLMIKKIETTIVDS